MVKCAWCHDDPFIPCVICQAKPSDASTYADNEPDRRMEGTCITCDLPVLEAQAALAERDAAREMVRAKPGERLDEAILRWGHAVAAGRCVCRFESGTGETIDECEPHAKIRADRDELRARAEAADEVEKRHVREWQDSILRHEQKRDEEARMRDALERRAEAAEQERDELRAEVERLRGALITSLRALGQITPSREWKQPLRDAAIVVGWDAIEPGWRDQRPPTPSPNQDKSNG